MTGTINFNLPVGPPSSTHASERLGLYPGGAGNPDYAVGIATGQFWCGIPAAADEFAWYAGTTEIYRLPGTGTPTLPIDLITLGYFPTRRCITFAEWIGRDRGWEFGEPLGDHSTRL
jgi:hypothetical protein